MNSRKLVDERQMERLGAAFARACRGGGVFHLRGGLGSGKTTFARGFIREAGHTGLVKSPTFTLVESYTLGGHRVHHFDLFRVADPEELEFMGVRDYFSPDARCLVEWSERGEGVLPPGDVRLDFAYMPRGRRVQWAAVTPRGREIVAALEPQ